MRKSRKHYELRVLAIRITLIVTDGKADCHTLCPDFYGNQLYTDEVECSFSPDSTNIAVGSSEGMLFITSRRDLSNTRALIIPGIFSPSETKLSSAKAFDFDPRFPNSRIAFGTLNGEIYLIDVSGDHDLKSGYVDCADRGMIQCLRYVPRGRYIAVATSEACIDIYDPDTLSLKLVLDAANQDSVPMEIDRNVYPRFLSMNFTTTGNHMASASTDGIVRVWQLPPDLTLQHLCRQLILTKVKVTEIRKLPIPPKMMLYLLSMTQSTSLSETM